ncbi:MAG: flippase [Methylococcaceae bacterium]
MISALTNKLKNKDVKVLASNFSFMFIIEISNYILPFLVIPYIVRVVGVEKYGIIVFATAVMIFFELIASYGFKLLAPKYISINRHDKTKISRYYWAVILTQLMLLVISFAIFIPLLFAVEKFSQEKVVFLFSFAKVLATVLFPIWFFQGIEKMKFIAIFNFSSRLLYTLAVVVFVNKESDYTLIPMLNGISFLGIAFFSLYYIHRNFGIKFHWSSFKRTKELLIDGWHLFISRISNVLYSTANTMLLGFIADYTVVGMLSIATTISVAVATIVSLVSSITFPYLARFVDTKDVLIRKAKKILKLYSSASLFTGIITFAVASTLIPLMYGEGKEESILYLQLLAFVVVLEPLGSFFTNYLVLKNQSSTVAKVTFYTMLVNAILIVPAIIYHQALGLVVVMIITQLFQVIMNIKYNQELIFNKKN